MLTAAVAAPESPSVAAVANNARRRNDGDGLAGTNVAGVARRASTAIAVPSINARSAPIFNYFPRHRGHPHHCDWHHPELSPATRHAWKYAELQGGGFATMRGPPYAPATQRRTAGRPRGGRAEPTSRSRWRHSHRRPRGAPPRAARRASGDPLA